MSEIGDHPLKREFPRKPDALFRGDLRDSHNNACVGYSLRGRGNHGPYTEGYRRGALRLAEHVNETGRDQDFLVYPIVFLYRHHIELLLKEIIVLAPHALGQEMTEHAKEHLTRHRLDLLWRDVKPIITMLAEQRQWGLPRTEMDETEQNIAEINALDASSMSFRYPTDKQGVSSLPRGLKNINIRHFAERMESASAFLDGIEMSLSEMADFNAEREAEYRSEMASYMDEGY